MRTELNSSHGALHPGRKVQLHPPVRLRGRHLRSKLGSDTLGRDAQPLQGLDAATLLLFQQAQQLVLRAHEALTQTMGPSPDYNLAYQVEEV
jgi:hypothetical protein